jgi:hypothetical protein
VAAPVSLPIAATSATPAANDPVRKCAHAPLLTTTTRQSSTSAAAWNCREVIRLAPCSSMPERVAVTTGTRFGLA